MQSEYGEIRNIYTRALGYVAKFKWGKNIRCLSDRDTGHLDESSNTTSKSDCISKYKIYSE
jgi:hypothetical protein